MDNTNSMDSINYSNIMSSIDNIVKRLNKLRGYL